MRKIDKDHEVALAKLGIEKERNDLLKDGLRRIGRVIGESITEEEEAEEPSGKTSEKGIVKIPCPNCKTALSIPPEAQVQGKEIICPKCKSKLAFEEG